MAKKASKPKDETAGAKAESNGQVDKAEGKPAEKAEKAPAKAKAEKKPKASQPKQDPDKGPAAIQRIKCEWGSVSVGEKSASIGYTVKLASYNLRDVHKYLCQRKISGSIACMLKDETVDQTKFFETDAAIHGAFDTGNISVGTDKASGRLSFGKEEIDLGVLGAMYGRTGMISIATLANKDDVEETVEKKEG